MKTHLYISKYKLQLKMVMLCMTFLMLGNTIEAQWIQVGQDIFNDSPYFQAVSINADGSVLAIGVPQNRINNFNGYVRIYRKTNDTWVQIGQDLVGEALGDAFGQYVSLNSDGTIVAIGAPGNDGNYFGTGHVRVFQNINDVWTKLGSDIEGGKGQKTVDGTQLGDYTGVVSLSNDGSVLAVGAQLSSDNGINAGKIDIYEYSGNSWVRKGNTILGEAEGDLFGTAVSINNDGTIVAAGGHYNSGSGVRGDRMGHVRIFEYNGSNWVKVGQNIDGEFGETSGNSVSLNDNGNVVAIGAINSKRARVYRNINNIWTQIGEDIIQYSKNGAVRVSLNSDGKYLVVGTPRAISNRGSARLYKNINDSWVQVNDQILGGQTADYFGSAVDINADGSYIALGGIGKMPNGVDSDVVKVYQNGLQLSVNQSSMFTVSPYPNPVINNFHVNFQQDGDYSFSIYDVSGKKIFHQQKVELNNTLNFSKYTSGIYILRIKDNSTYKIQYVKIIRA